jgi:hypothetical protein
VAKIIKVLPTTHQKHIPKHMNTLCNKQLCMYFFKTKTTWQIFFILKNKYFLWQIPSTFSPPAVKTQWLSQCQAFQRLVRSSHTLVNWTFDLLNRFSISLACFWKHWLLFTSVCNINTPGQWKEPLGQTSQSLCSSFSSALSLGVA